MMPARRPIPLFDLVNKRGGASDAPAKPTIRVELKPMSAPRPAAASPTMAPAPMRLPINAAYIAVAGVIILLILAWVGGVKWGTRQEAARAEKQLSAAFRAPPGISEPSANANPSGPTTPRQPATNPPPVLGAGLILTPTGTSTDPRQAGLNYLALAVLPTDAAKAAMGFLKTNGLETFAVPVDPKGVEANNRDPGAGLYRLYAAPGVTSDQYKMNQTARTNLEAQAARLGQTWQKQHRGPSNFAKSGWYKFQ